MYTLKKLVENCEQINIKTSLSEQGDYNFKKC